jgi:hypothetical protein
MTCTKLLLMGRDFTFKLFQLDAEIPSLVTILTQVVAAVGYRDQDVFASFVASSMYLSNICQPSEPAT